MRFALDVATPPTEEPLSLDQAKAHLRVDGNEDDELIESLLTAAREKVESDAGVALMTQTLDLYLDGFPDQDLPVRLRRRPVQSVTSVTYRDASGASVVLATTEYRVDTVGARIGLKDRVLWPITDGELNAVTVRFVAGYTDVANIPERFKTALRLLLGHWYENREAIAVGPNPIAVPLGYRSLVQSGVRFA